MKTKRKWRIQPKDISKEQFADAHELYGEDILDLEWFLEQGSIRANCPTTQVRRTKCRK